jgi:DNA replication protein DnaC
MFDASTAQRRRHHESIGDAALTTAILDRLLHRSVLLKFRGRSYRLKEAAARLVKASPSA